MFRLVFPRAQLGASLPFLALTSSRQCSGPSRAAWPTPPLAESARNAAVREDANVFQLQRLAAALTVRTQQVRNVVGRKVVRRIVVGRNVVGRNVVRLCESSACVS